MRLTAATTIASLDRAPCQACGQPAEVRPEREGSGVLCHHCGTFAWLPRRRALEPDRAPPENTEAPGPSRDESRAPGVLLPTNHPAATADGPPVPRTPMATAEPRTTSC